MPPTTQTGYQPLTPQQFSAAKKAGFSTDQIVQHEQTRKASSGGSSAVSTPSVPKTFGQQLGDAAGAAVNFINNNPISKGITSLAALPVQLGAKALGAPDPFANGIGAQQNSILPSVKPAAVTTYQGKTDAQYGSEELGNAAQVGSLFFPYGRAAGVAEKGLAPLLGKTIGGGLAKVASGAAGGYGVDVASNLQSGKPLNESLTPGLGTGIGAAIPVAGPAIGALARGTGETLGVSTGAGYGAIKEAFNAASAGGERAKAYTDALRGKTLPEDIVDEAKSSLGQIISDRSKAYQSQLAQVSKDNTKSFDISPVQKKLDTMLGDFNVEKTKTGALDFSRSPGLGRYKTDLQDIQDVLDNWGSKPGDRTVVGIDKLKQTLDDFRRGTADSRKFDSFVTALRNSAKDIIAKEPGYAKLVGDYGEKTGLIKEIQKGLSLGDKASIDTGFRKLTTALRTNNEFRKELIGELDHASGGFLSSKIAGQQLSEALPRGLAKQIEGFGAIGAVASGVGIIPLLKVAAFASPRIVGEIVNALGISKKVFTQLLDHLGAQTAQFPGDRAVEEAGPAVKNYFEKNPPSLGGAIKDVNTMKPAELLEMVRKASTPEDMAADGALSTARRLGIEKQYKEAVRSGFAQKFRENGAGLPPEIPKALGGGPDTQAFQGFEDVSTKVLEDLKGRTTVSKQYVLDALNRADIKQAEKDIIKPILDQEGPTIKVSDFANKIKTELLPLERVPVQDEIDTPARYESVALPDELRGPVANYGEHIYESPIETSAGEVHFGEGFPNYFAHTRVEDLPPDELTSNLQKFGEEYVPNPLGEDGTTRRVIELQSDLFQKGRLEKEGADSQVRELAERKKYAESLLGGSEPQEPIKAELKVVKEALAGLKPKYDARQAEIAKLEPYKNTWQDRIVREEVKQAAKDGKTILQFPTGETAMKIEGLVNRSDKWVTLDNQEVNGTNIKPGDLITYQTHEGTPHEDRRFLVTKNNGDGTFSAVDSLTAENDHELYNLLERNDMLDDGRVPSLEELQDVQGISNNKPIMKRLDELSEQLSAKDTVDQSNPIYKYYEKELGKFLKNKYNAERVTDPQGQTWYQVNVPEAAAKAPVQAFGKAKIGALAAGAGASAALAGGIALGSIPQKLSASTPQETPQAPVVRGVPITPQDLSELRNTLFAEISNRDSQKQGLEARTIINTALNRVAQYAKKGKNLSLAEVLKQPNQYQGSGSKEYNRIKNGLLMPTDQQKVQAIDEALRELAGGRFTDNTSGAVYYQHAPDGSIHYDDSKTLYQK